MTISEEYLNLKNELNKIYDEKESINIANLVLEKISGLNKVDRLLNKTKPLTADQQETFSKYKNDLLNHKPVQYVLNEAWFAGMKFYVDESVLIPRPETEELVDWITNDLKAQFQNSPINILDIGTGSGCIAIALKKKLKNAEIFALDISQESLNTAKKNAALNNVMIKFFIADILSKNLQIALPQFNAIVSNPPYITRKEMNEMNNNVIAYEPHTALFVPDEDPLLFYKQISEFAVTYLKKNGSLYFEINEQYAEQIANLLNKKRFHSIELKKDLQGKDRMVKAVYNLI